MGWIIRLKRKQLVGSTGEDDIYPITSTGAVYNEGGKDLDTILRELQEAQYTKVLQEVVKNGNILHFSYTDETIKDIQLPNAFTDVDLTKSGDDNTITFTFADGTSKSIVITAPEQEQADWEEEDENSKAFIKNKPEIPTGNVQSDWNQTDQNAGDYIKNKPNIPVVDAVDINVNKWGDEADYSTNWVNGRYVGTEKNSLLYAVGMSKFYNQTGIYTRIHIINDFNITTDTQIDTSNCEILGHARTVKMNGHSFNSTGKFLRINDLRIARIWDEETEPDTTINDKYFKLSMNSDVAYMIFDTVTFFNFPLMDSSFISSGVATPHSFNFIGVSNGSESRSVHIILQNCQWAVRPTRLGSNYTAALRNADYINCLVRVIVTSEIGAFSIECTNNIGGIEKVNNTNKYIIAPQKIIVKLSQAVSQDMFLYSDGTVDYRYTINDSTDTTIPKPNGYYVSDKCKVWYRLNNETMVNLQNSQFNFVLNDGGIEKVKTMTETAYNQLSSKDNSTIYFLT